MKADTHFRLEKDILNKIVRTAKATKTKTTLTAFVEVMFTNLSRELEAADTQEDKKNVLMQYLNYKLIYKGEK